MGRVEARLTSTSKLGWEEALVAAHALGRDELVRDIIGRIERCRPGCCRRPSGPTASASGRCSATTPTSASVPPRRVPRVRHGPAGGEVQTEHAECCSGGARPRGRGAARRGARGVRAAAGKALARAATRVRTGRGREVAGVSCPSLRYRERRGTEVLPRVRQRPRARLPDRAAPRTRRGRGSAASAATAFAGAAPPARRAELRPPSGAWSRSSSPTSSASPRFRGARLGGRRASSSRATSTPRQRLIELYGGTVEKFIGDAVMAVWGTPVANEDDAERAVRAALDLVAAVRLGELDPALARGRAC